MARSREVIVECRQFEDGKWIMTSVSDPPITITGRHIFGLMQQMKDLLIHFFNWADIDIVLKEIDA